MRFVPPFAVDANAPLDVELVRESLRLRCAQTAQSQRPMLVAVAVAALSFGLTLPAWRVLGWALPVALVTYLKARHAKKLLTRIDSATPVELGRMQGETWWKTFASQLTMGLMIWWLGDASAQAVAAVVTALQLIYVGGALVNASTDPPSMIPGAWVNLGAAALFWATRGGDGLAMAAALVGMGLVVTRSCQRSAETFRETLRMRFENADLVRRLADEKRAADEANAAKSRFLASASHDLRQPLHALLVFASILRKNQTPETAELVGHIRDAASSLDKLFAGLLDLSKLDTGAIVPQLQAVDVAAILEELVNEYRPTCEAKGVSIACDGGSAWVLSDPFLLERILRNLVDNAVKYTASGQVRIEVEAAGSEVRVAVRDTGPGIDRQLHERIFEEYFQIGNAARDLSKGSGLGLAIVRRLCALLNTSLCLESESGRGACFALTLQQAPLYDMAGPGADPAGTGEAPLHGVHVWLVEDNPLVRLATRRALEAWGCTVCDWEAMPDFAGPGAPSAVIADYRLGEGQTGIDVARAVRSRWPGLPVAIMTGDIALGRAAVRGFENLTLLQKPVLPAVLTGWLREQCMAEESAPRADADQAILTP